MNLRLMTTVCMILGLAGCAQTPDREVAALTATAMQQLENDIQAKVDAERAFAKAIARDGEFAAQWNVAIGTELALLRAVEEFSDVALTERAGVPRVGLQHFLRTHNDRARDMAANAGAAVADEETRLAVAFQKVVFQRAKWRAAHEATLQLARRRSSEDRFRLLLATARDAWKQSQESQDTISGVADEPLE